MEKKKYNKSQMECNKNKRLTSQKKKHELLLILLRV